MKLAIVVLVIIVALIGVGLWYSQQSGAPATDYLGSMATTSSNNSQTADNANSSAAAVTSQSSVDSDTSSIDSQMNAYSFNSAEVDQGLNDQQVQ